MPVKSKDKKEQNFLLELITNGSIGLMLKDKINPQYVGDKKVRAPGLLVDAILYGGLAQISSRAFVFDAMLTQMLRERTEHCLEHMSYEDLAEPRKLLKAKLEELEKKGRPRPIPQVLTRYCRGRKFSFKANSLDMEVSTDQIQELLDQYPWLPLGNNPT